MISRVESRGRLPMVRVEGPGIAVRRRRIDLDPTLHQMGFL
jgi:hypothetical protein